MNLDIFEKYYGKRKVLGDIHLHFKKGETTLIIGTSGSGKSTLIKCIAGSTHFDGFVSDYTKGDIGYIPQYFAFNTMETVRDDLFWRALFSCRYDSLKSIREEVLKHISMMGLIDEKNSLIKNLSEGQLRRVVFAKELIKKKKIIIADEIDTGLDARESHLLVKTIADITRKQNLTTIIISYNLHNIELYDNVVVLAEDSAGVGRIAYSGRVSEMNAFFDEIDFVDVFQKLIPPEAGGFGMADYYIKKYEDLCMERSSRQGQITKSDSINKQYIGQC